MVGPLHAQALGDANNSGSIDIVDALVIAQYYVGLNPNPFSTGAADVNCDNTIDIVDALLISQYYVGLISEFPCSSPTSPPTGNWPTASEIVSQMKIGWNQGNTLEAICGENAWGQPSITQTLINAVKAAGFKSIRLPCAWDCHATNGTIDPAWITRVKEVVGYCMNADLYLSLIHI